MLNETTIESNTTSVISPIGVSVGTGAAIGSLPTFTSQKSEEPAPYDFV